MIISFMAIETAVVNAFFFIFILLIQGFYCCFGFGRWFFSRLLLLTTDGQLEMFVCRSRFRFRSCTIVSRHLPLIYLPEPYFS